ncbi:MAG TPA: VWA domain-containing protein, partial [Gemmataceae bacterium]|nr:VWA domain-containing protein [Gemmataceae bacterium]
MSHARRFLAVGVVLALAAAFTTSSLWGEPEQLKARRDAARDASRPGGEGGAAAKADPAEEPASRITAEPALLYRAKDGKRYFSYQLRPDLGRPPARPRDLLLLVDTSASQAGAPLQTAIKVVEAAVASLQPDDRVAVWTVSTTARDLSGKTFTAPADAGKALQALRAEFPAGGTNLKQGLRDALAAFRGRDRGRQRCLVFLGDGMSVEAPLSEGDRAQLAGEMVREEVAFYPVPLGLHLHAHNLHGLATGSGGLAVRVLPEDSLGRFTKRLHEALAAPILYPTSFDLAPGAAEEFYPTRLPPLRGDAATLVVGVAGDGKELAWTVRGKVAGKEVVVRGSQALPEAELDNYFLKGVVSQWRAARDRPALLPAPRALGAAYEQTRLAKLEYVAQAELALGNSRPDVAHELFRRALEVDPDDAEARAGKSIAEKLQDGRLRREQLAKELLAQAGDRVWRIARRQPGDRPRADLRKLDEQPPEAAPPAAPDDLLGDVRRRQAAEEQRLNQVVEETLREAERVLRSDPDAAHDLLKRALDNVRSDAELAPEARQRLAGRLGRALRSADQRGARIKQDIDQRLQVLARERERLAVETARMATEDRVRERMRVFHNLMNQAREKTAIEQASKLREDLVSRGLPVPAAVTAAYAQSLAGYHLREVQELRRIREERWLATMLEVEKSHVPFPDEPPVRFPDAEKWRRLSEFRLDKYESMGFGGQPPESLTRLRKKLVEVVNFDGFDDPKLTLEGALEYLADRYDVTIEVLEPAFKAAGYVDKSVLSEPVATTPIPKMRGVTLATVLRKVLARVPTPPGKEATFLIRRDHIEVTTADFQAAEKTVRVYAVGDLVMPIPGQVTNSMAMLGMSIFGMMGFGMNMMGMMGMGMPGMMMGMMGMGNLMGGNIMGLMMGMGGNMMGMGMMGMGMPGMMMGMGGFNM